MTGYKETFKVVSKTKKENEKEDEKKTTYHVFLQGINNTGQKINLHSENQIPVTIGDEFELKAVDYQKTIKGE